MRLHVEALSERVQMLLSTVEARIGAEIDSDDTVAADVTDFDGTASNIMKEWADVVHVIDKAIGYDEPPFADEEVHEPHPVAKRRRSAKSAP